MVVNGKIPFRHTSCLVLMGFHLAWLRVPLLYCVISSLYVFRCAAVEITPGLVLKLFVPLQRMVSPCLRKITWAGKAILKNFKDRE